MKRLVLCFALSVAGLVMAQAVPRASAPEQLHGRALAAVQAERARAKQPVCPRAVVTLEINECYQRELGISNGNYGKLVRALGALMRSGDDAKGPTARIPFDDGETAWSNYRDAACKADGAQYEGGTMRPGVEMGCQLTLVRSHMEELWKLYSDAGRQ